MKYHVALRLEGIDYESTHETGTAYGAAIQTAVDSLIDEGYVQQRSLQNGTVLTTYFVRTDANGVSILATLKSWITEYVW